MCKSGILIIDLNCLTTATSCSSVCQKLRLATPFKTAELINYLLDCLSHCQDAVVLQQQCLLLSDSARDLLSFVCEDETIVLLKDDVILGSGRASGGPFLAKKKKTL